MAKNIIIVGSGNAAMSAGIAALEAGANVLMLEKADEELAGGNTKYTAGAMRFAYNGSDELITLLTDPQDERIARTDFGSYTQEKFSADLLGFNEGLPLSTEQEYLISNSSDAVKWLAGHGVTYEPIYSRQSFEKDGKILDIKTFKLNEEQIKEFYEDYYDQAIDLLSFQKYKYNQLPTKIKKLIN